MASDRTSATRRGAGRPVGFQPVSPTELVARLAHWIDRAGTGRLRVGFDGDEAVGTADLADRVAAVLTGLGRPTIRTGTRWWWRAASLRLEHGRHDLQSRLTGWVDGGALSRELLGPLGPTGTGRYLLRLRDPERDRAVREPYRQAPDRAVLLLDGPLLATLGLDLDLRLKVGVSPARLRRVLPDDRQWEVEAFDIYDREWPQPAVLLSYDHPATPAVRGLPT